jgi:hypothetical protein
MDTRPVITLADVDLCTGHI